MYGAEDIEAKMKAFDRYMNECDKRPFIHISEIVSSGLFDSINEIEVFFFTFDGEYYSTDISLINQMGELYTGMLDEMNINRLFYRD